MKNSHRDLVIFDTMGVIFHFPEGDDVKYGLWPFLEGKGIVFSSEEKERYETEFYRKGTLGELSSSEFLQKIVPKSINVQSLEDEYLASDKFVLAEDLVTVLENLKERYVLGVLSNDIAKWNKKLRQRFTIDKYFDLIVISDEAKGRKPEKKIFEYALAKIKSKGFSPQRTYFVDDSLENLHTASTLNMRTIYKVLKTNDDHPYTPDYRIKQLSELLQLFNF